jgi:hypothetical protein
MYSDVTLQRSDVAGDVQQSPSREMTVAQLVSLFLCGNGTQVPLPWAVFGFTWMQLIISRSYLLLCILTLFSPNYEYVRKQSVQAFRLMIVYAFTIAIMCAASPAHLFMIVSLIIQGVHCDQ